MSNGADVGDAPQYADAIVQTYGGVDLADTDDIDDYFLDIENLTKPHIDYLRNKFNIKTHQVKRVAASYFLKSKGAGRPERFTKTNNIMKQWIDMFLSTYDRPPNVEETLIHGQYIKSLNMIDQSYFTKKDIMFVDPKQIGSKGVGS